MPIYLVCQLKFNSRLLFFFSSRRRHTRLQGDWSSDVCSSDLYFNISKKILYGYSIFVLSILLYFSTPLTAQPALPPGFNLAVDATAAAPIGIAFTTDGKKMFVWEKGGIVYLFNHNSTSNTYVKQATPVLNISEETGNWQDHGLLGFALDPNFAVNGRIYLAYVVDRHYLINFGTLLYNSASNEYFKATIGRVTRYTTVMSGSNL